MGMSWMSCMGRATTGYGGSQVTDISNSYSLSPQPQRIDYPSSFPKFILFYLHDESIIEMKHDT